MPIEIVEAGSGGLLPIVPGADCVDIREKGPRLRVGKMTYQKNCRGWHAGRVEGRRVHEMGDAQTES